MPADPKGIPGQAGWGVLGLFYVSRLGWWSHHTYYVENQEPLGGKEGDSDLVTSK